MWVRTILISGPPRRLLDKAGDGSTFREIRQLATWILWFLNSAASLILTEKRQKYEGSAFVLDARLYVSVIHF